MTTRTRYHWILVVVHWLVAALVLTEALIGVFFLHEMPNGQAKVPVLTVHMILGLVLLGLMIVRVIARAVTSAPEPATVGSKFLDWTASATHFLLYLFAFLAAMSGILLAVGSHVLQLVAGGKVEVPMSFSPLLHAGLFVLFGMLVFLHTAAAFYHQFILHDNLMGRMWFRSNEKVYQRYPNPLAE